MIVHIITKHAAYKNGKISIKNTPKKKSNSKLSVSPKYDYPYDYNYFVSNFAYLLFFFLVKRSLTGKYYTGQMEGEYNNINTSFWH